VQRHVDRGQLGNVLGREDVHPAGVRARLDRRDAVLGLVGDRHLARRQQPDDIAEQLRRDDDRTLALDRRRNRGAE